MKRSIKLLFLLGMCVMSVSTAFSQNEQEIELRKEAEIGEPDGGRSLEENVPTATLYSSVLTICFPEATSSQVVITDSQTYTVVYSNSFGVATGQVISLSTLCAGEYELSIYAFGKWWWGEFVIEEE